MDDYEEDFEEFEEDFEEDEEESTATEEADKKLFSRGRFVAGELTATATKKAPPRCPPEKVLNRRREDSPPSLLDMEPKTLHKLWSSSFGPYARLRSKQVQGSSAKAQQANQTDPIASENKGIQAFEMGKEAPAERGEEMGRLRSFLARAGPCIEALLLGRKIRLAPRNPEKGSVLAGLQPLLPPQQGFGPVRAMSAGYGMCAVCWRDAKEVALLQAQPKAASEWFYPSSAPSAVAIAGPSTVVVGCDDGSLVAFEMAKGGVPSWSSAMWRWTGGEVSSMCQLPDETHLVAASEWGIGAAWSLRRVPAEASYKAADRGVCIDSRTSADAASLALFDEEEGALDVCPLSGAHQGEIAVSLAGGSIIHINRLGRYAQPNYYELPDGMAAIEGAARSLCCAPDGDAFVAGFHGGAVALFSPDRRLPSWVSHLREGVASVRLASVGHRTVVLALSATGALHLMEGSNGTHFHTERVANGEPTHMTSLCHYSGETCVLLGRSDGGVDWAVLSLSDSL